MVIVPLRHFFLNRRKGEGEFELFFGENRTITKKFILTNVLVFCTLFAGCGKDIDIENKPETEEYTIVEEDKQAEERYLEFLESGGQVCPEFPETETLAQVDEQFLLDSICPAVVRLEDGKLFGSGIIWKMEEESIWIVTNQHMFSDDEDGMLSVVFWDGIRTNGEIVRMSEQYDLGVIKVNLEETGYYTATRYFSVRYDVNAYETATPGDDIFIIGSADYSAGNLFYGTIGNRSVYMAPFGTEMLWAYCEVKAGMSGSGVFDRYGNLLGIVCAGNDEKEAAVLPIDKILAEWEDALY